MSSFEQISNGKEGCLIQAALEFAKDEYPHLDVNDYLRTIHRFACDFNRFRGNETQPENVLRLLSDFFFGELEFTGNTENYYDPRNSYLNDVIDRRMGIPISLSVVYQHLADAAGVKLSGINFPGHFLLAYDRPDDRIYIDVFQCGRWIDWNECQVRLMEAMGGSVDVKESDLSSMASRDILLRMLRNLKGIYSRCDLSRCLNVQHRIVTLSDNDPTEIQDLGILYFHLGKPVLAVKTFDKLMREHPTLGEREVVKSYMSKATQKAVLLN